LMVLQYERGVERESGATSCNWHRWCKTPLVG
jgi:hypothetical protein